MIYEVQESSMQKIDYKKEFKHLYTASSKEAVFVRAPSRRYLMIDGMGDPNTAAAAKKAIETLFPLAYAIKFKIKKEIFTDYSVMPLEGLWWADDMEDFTAGHKDLWRWTYMICQPEIVTQDIFRQVLSEIVKKKQLTAISKVRFEILEEGYCAQILHLGPFSEEGKTISMLHNFIKENGFEFDGLINKHHEIYLSDYRKTSPEKLKTILRQPVLKK
jgi:hypothetical protein